jgi:hypothetical protein
LVGVTQVTPARIKSNVESIVTLDAETTAALDAVAAKEGKQRRFTKCVPTLLSISWPAVQRLGLTAGFGCLAGRHGASRSASRTGEPSSTRRPEPKMISSGARGH